jgi:uncharacterized membrane protein YfcA
MDLDLALIGDALSGSTALAVLVAGWLIGATGIGGVLVVPALVSLQGTAAAPAIAASALAFAFPGVAALWAARGAGHTDGPREGAPSLPLIPLLAAAGIGALVGAWLVHRLRPEGLLLALAALAIASGLRGLLPARSAGTARAATPLGKLASAALGAAVGVGSGLTGTGGPVLLMPALMLLRQPLRPVIVAAQLIQLPVALAASLGHAQSGRLDLSLAIALGVLLLAGSLAGQWVGRRLATRHLQMGVCWLLLATGLWLGVRAISS